MNVDAIFAIHICEDESIINTLGPLQKCAHKIFANALAFKPRSRFANSSVRFLLGLNVYQFLYTTRRRLGQSKPTCSRS